MQLIAKRIGKAIEPITIEECRTHLRLEFEPGVDSPTDSPATFPEDVEILRCLAGARQAAEDFTQLSIALQRWEVRTDAFPCTWTRGQPDGLELPRPPLVSVESIVYTDDDGATQAYPDTDWFVDSYSGVKARILPAFDTVWPSARRYAGSIAIRYTSGYRQAVDSPYVGLDSPVDSPFEEDQALPPAIRAAILLQLGHLWENREDSTVGVESFPLVHGAQSLLLPHRLETGI